MEELQSEPHEGEDRSVETAESLRALRERAGQTLGDHRQRVSEIEVRLNEQLEQLAAELTRERVADQQTLAAAAEQSQTLEELRKTLAEKEAEVVEVLEQLSAQSAAFEAQIVERDDELAQLLELSDEESQQRDALEQELSVARQSLENLRTDECGECQRIRDELAAVADKLQQFDQQIRDLQAQLEAKQTELDQANLAAAGVAEQNQQVTAQLAAAEAQIEELTAAEQADDQLEQTRRKFELALADVHKLKRENAELHEELASRPEANDQESPELVSLRSERDALVEKVAELENAPESSVDGDSQHELEDLQRRFELAVDDVRQLKQENAELRQKLESSPGSPVTPAGDEPQDWQAQKARLMATLDAEDQGMIDEPRREERAKIEGAISITDRVVAEKDAIIAERDAEIAELKSQLQSRPEGQDREALREEIAAEILNDDDAVKAEVDKLQQKQASLDAKLREAELDISLRRATLAREQAALEEKLALLPELEAIDEGSAPDKPKRRWLSALGLKDEEES